jgi:hypothetical protein
MTHRRTLVWFLSLLCLLGLVAGALPAAADGTLGDSPNPIGAPYGSTRAIDADNDATCTDTQDRGDLLDFHAFSATATNGSRWYFAFVVDSDAGMVNGSIDSPNYFVILDDPSSAGANGNDNIPFWSDTSPYSAGWTRNMLTPGTHFVACYANGADTLVCDLYDNYKQEVAGVDDWTVTTTTLGGRRYVELALPDDADVPAYLRNNSAINTLVISTYNSDSHGNPIDAVGTNVALNCHNNAKTGGDGRTFTAAEMIATAANCKAGGRPTDTGANDRQCLSFPARTTTTVLNDITECTAANAGVIVNGTATNDDYTLLTEAAFAGPYQGGDSTRSDFQGESASYRFCNGSGMCTGVNGADIVNLYVRGDAYFLYLVVAGELDSFNRSGGGGDLANLYLPIDLPGVTSNSAEGTTTGVPNSAEFPNAPASRYVNFKGWDVDYVVELVWHGNVNGTDAAKLYDYTGSRTWSSSNFTVMSAKNTADHTNQTPPSAANLYYGRDTKTYEFAIPWAALGYAAWTGGSGSNQPTCTGACQPALADIIRVGAYSTADSNAVSGENRWDAYDQAPGIGQGCNGLGCHERLGDEWEDTDDNRTGGEADGSPYSGLTRGTGDRSSSDPAGLDVDTIESYFQFTLAPEDRECIPNGNPLAVTLAAFEAEAQADRVLVSWETASEIGNRGFNLYRGVSPDGWDRQLNELLIPSQAPGSPSGFTYTWQDQADLVPGATYYYWLQDLDVTGATTLHGPVSVDFVAPTAVRLEGVSATPALAGGAALPWLLAVAGAGAALALGRRRR